VASGTEVEIVLNMLQKCSRCGGSGAESGTKNITCPRCNGRGRIEQRSQSIFGQMIRVTTCDRCEGRGEIAETPCRACRGRGLEEGRARLSVTVPPGVEDGTQLVLRGQGEDGPYGGPPGDLYVTIRIKPHPYLIRRGRDVIYEAGISFPEAALGTSIEVPTLTGEKALEVPAGTQSGTILRMRGEGMQSRYGKGDQIVHITVHVPEKLTRTQRELIEELAKEFEAELKRRSRWWK
jgi:molecular chaperone DnaJ